ncbi:hypothetical protein HOL34_01385 [bacterium]|jgi:hypothetical protein|nr:hypothetical protein [bacterium]MBT3903565.1 hypothetical protein [bacterium]MBT4578241.1 hypothetical protein [bacterium]MBT5345708.1 hypothetical protein [bacterium]MBT6130790.1 hypothetical protein [bacterium]
MNKLYKLFLSILFFVIPTINSTSAKINTVFVHGIFNLQKHARIGLLPRLFKDKIDGTVYDMCSPSIRKQRYEYDAQPIQELGGHPVNNKSPHGTRHWTAMFKEMEQKYRPTKASDNFYTFGWSGNLSLKARMVASKKLYDFIKNLSGTVRIVSFSHGGDVSGLLHRIRQEFPNDTFVIDELVTIGTPIIDNSYEVAKANIFKKMYHIYSYKDKIQIFDIFSPNKRLFSQRRFIKNGKTNLPNHLSQVEIRLVGHDKWGKKFIDNPGHVELWFFSWKSALYRDRLPISPFPVASFIPYIIAKIEPAAKNGLNRHNLIMEFNPGKEECRVWDKKYRNKKMSYPFPSDKQISEWAHKITPAPKKPKWYKEIIPYARRQARKAQSFRIRHKRYGVSVPAPKETGIDQYSFAEHVTQVSPGQYAYL